MAKCPYRDCDVEGSQEQVDDHIDYMVKVGDNEHEFGENLPADEPETIPGDD